ncbi:MAG: DnaJ domain-containing protein [Gammaproteobacteria bacterium]|nr:DnaJ domain-containing protein [Gammaproteobacteria bacterium]MCY4358126.1 DnaJ domain-containing protein [Gammaproteobacteria bacterium]
MIFRLLLLILLPIMAWYLVRSARTRFNLTGRQTQILFAIIAVLLVVAVLVVMGRLPVHFILAPLGAAGAFLLRFLPTMLRLLPFWQMLRSRSASAQTRRSGQASTIRTEFLAMELQHDTGHMDGKVLRGSFAGQLLSAMGLPQLLELREECASDVDSLQVLEAYLDRTHEAWRTGEEHENSSVPMDESKMTRALALEILGLQEGASEKEISAAHRTLMQKLHPDRGGTDYLAKKINMAKDFLLK